MKKLFFYILIILLPSFALAQKETTVSGTVVDNKNKPLRGASIAIKDSYDGATADSLGRFRFTTTEKDSMIIEVSSIGYRSFSKKIFLDGTPITLNAILKEKINEEKAVIVTAGAFEASDKKRVTVLSSIDIVTTASANADVTGALKTLPGTQQVGESEGLFVRGGTATESKIFIDGTQVNNFFYSSTPGIATRGRFNPFLFKGTVFSTGGYSALYGQALSSALILESIDLPEQSSADIGISVVGLGAGFQKLAKNKKASWGITGSATNLKLAFALIPQRQDFFKLPTFYESDFNFRVKTSKTGMLKYYGYVSSNTVGIRNPDIDSSSFKSAFNLNNFNTYHNISLKEKLGKGWKLQLGLSYTWNTDSIRQELQTLNNTPTTVSSPFFFLFKNFGVRTHQQFLQHRAVFEKKLPGISQLRLGWEYSHSNERQQYTGFSGTTVADTVKENLTALFTEADIYATNDIAVKAGTRAEYSQLLAKWNLAPRLALAYKLNRVAQLSLAFGQFYQNPDRRLLPTSFNVDFSKATHYVLQYQKVTSLQTLRTEVFYKNYDALYKSTFGTTGREVVSNTLGNGYAKGFELFWRDKKTIKNLDYWVSYSYLDTKRDFNLYPRSLVPPFAMKHTANLVLKKFVLKWKTGFNASYTYASGRPFYDFKTSNFPATTVIRNQGKTIPYNNLSFSVNYLPYLGKQNSKKFMVLVASVSNVLGQRQIFNYNFSNNGNNKVAITPTSKRFVFVGCFISLGVDRTENAINGNL